VPRVPSHVPGVTHHAVSFNATSVDITLLSLLLRTHAPDQIPPSISVFPCTLGLCRLSLLPAGRWPFPTLSLQSLYWCLVPYPAVPPWCTCPLLPKKQRPHLRGNKFGTLNYPCNATSTGSRISGLQTFRYVQAPILARPPSCTYSSVSISTEQSGLIHHAYPISLPQQGVASLHVRHEQLT
jgi:hypothetical protein